MMIKTRFCPSPTGYLHLGNVRTALFSALFARCNQGVFLLRIEDTDKLRSDELYTQALMSDLQWLQLPWEEGPYYQSERQSIYDQYYDQLINGNRAYPCFCTEEKLNLQRQLQQKSGKPPRYAGGCFQLSRKEVQEKIDAGLKPTLRFRMPEDEIITFVDLVRGEQRFNSNDLGDFIIRRTDGTAPFMYCNAIDDALMGVTHVLRGEDHLANTPRQMAILKALNLPIAAYGHIALIVGQDGSPLSKRHGSRSIHKLREEGFLPLAIVNYLARLGHYFGHDEFLAIEQLAEQFKTEALAKSPAKFNEQQLLFWQTQAVAHLTDREFWTWAAEAMEWAVPDNKRANFVAAVKPNVQFPADAAAWANAFFGEKLTFTDEQKSILQATSKQYFDEALIILKQVGANAEKITTHLKEKCQVKGRALFMPLRIALTAHEHGPDLAIIFALMGEDMIRARLESLPC